jgi:hypothetical protein
MRGNKIHYYDSRVDYSNDTIKLKNPNVRHMVLKLNIDVSKIAKDFFDELEKRVARKTQTMSKFEIDRLLKNAKDPQKMSEYIGLSILIKECEVLKLEYRGLLDLNDKKVIEEFLANTRFDNDDDYKPTYQLNNNIIHKNKSNSVVTNTLHRDYRMKEEYQINKNIFQSNNDLSNYHHYGSENYKDNFIRKGFK